MPHPTSSIASSDVGAVIGRVPVAFLQIPRSVSTFFGQRKYEALQFQLEPVLN